MNWLLWREYRLNRWILVTGAAAVLASYLIGFLLGFFNVDDELDEDVGEVLVLGWSVLTVALLAGNAFAGERADRSAEFIAYLPLQRRRTLISKLLLHLIVLVALLAVNLPMLGQPFGLDELGVGIGIALLLYGVNWLVSSIQSSPALATVSGFLTLMLFALVAAMYEDLTRTPGSSDWLQMMITLPVAIVCFSVGIWYYLRGSKP
jgi:ABC-type transport system involved in multi-copper enzyme maturation permease subunit